MDGDDTFSDGDDFVYANKVTRESFLKELELDPANPQQSVLNISQISFNVDKFLFKNYRFTSLEDLQRELTLLLKELDQELLDMVNNDYFDFIDLGKSLNGGEILVDKVRVDVTKYKKRLVDETKRLEHSEAYVTTSLANLKKLKTLKKHAQHMLLLEKFINTFETLLNENKEYIKTDVLKQLTSLYLSIHQLLTSLPQYKFVQDKAEAINILRYEYRGILDEHLKNIKIDQTSYQEITTLLSIYSIIGDEKTAVALLKDQGAQ